MNKTTITKFWIYYKTNKFSRTKKLYVFSSNIEDAEKLFKEHEDYEKLIFVRILKEFKPLCTFELKMEDERGNENKALIETHSEEDVKTIATSFFPNLILRNIIKIEKS